MILLALIGFAAAFNTTRLSERRQLRKGKGAGHHMDGVKAWVREKANNDAPSLVGELKALRANAGTCTLDAKKCKHQNNGLPCAPLREGCKRPCGAFSVKLYGAAGATMREGVLMHLWGSSQAPGGGAGKFAPKDSKWRSSQVEGSTLADPRWLSSARHYAKRNAWFVTVLRDPLQRVWSRYWYDTGGSITEEKWLDDSKCGGGGRGVGNRCLSNYYVRTFRAHPRPDAFGPDYNNGLPVGDLELAKGVLDGAFDDVLISEWLSHPGTIQRLSEKLCFVPTRRKFPRGKRQNKKAKQDSIISPSFLVKRAPGGKSDKKPAGWAPSAGYARERVAYMNELDVDLYAWAAARELALLKQTAAAADGLPLPGETWRGVEDF